MSDDAMELLCTLSPHPSSLRQLADDFRVNEARILELMTELKNEGFKVKRVGSRHGEFVHIQHEFFKPALGAGLSYWMQTYQE